MNRPVGVTILAVLNLIGGFIGGIFSLLFFVFSGLFFVGGVVSGNSQITNSGALGISTNVVSLAVSILAIAISYGLFTLKPWAWTVAYFVQIVNIITNVLKFFEGDNALGALINTAIALAILYYLNQAEVKTAFGRVAAGD